MSKRILAALLAVALLAALPAAGLAKKAKKMEDGVHVWTEKDV